MRTIVSSCSHHPLFHGLVLSLVLGLPAIADAKPASPQETVSAAKSSPLFRRELRRAEITKAGLKTISVSRGVDMDFQRYVTETALNRRPELAPLFAAKLPAGYLERAPTYQEAIYELEDRVVVDRRMTVVLADGACSKPSRPKAVTDLCFIKDPKNKPDKDVRAELVKIRAMAKMNPMRVFHGKINGHQVMRMSDEQLLDLMLNTDERTIRHVSIVSRQPTVGGATLRNFKAKLKAAAGADLVPAGPSGSNVKGPTVAGTQQRTFDTKYFLTGFTLGRQIEDTLEYEIAKKRSWHARYYVQIDYHLDAAFGVRVPFSVDVVATGTGDSRNVAVSVDPIKVDANGSPAYTAVGLPKNQTHEGKEFVFHLKAGCDVYARLPRKKIEKSCSPSIDFDEGRNIAPVLGSERSNIPSWWINGTRTGLNISAAKVLTASLDIGVDADVTNGRIGMRAAALPSSGMTGLQNGNLSFTNRNPISFTSTRSQNTASAGFRLEKPTYGFDLGLRPALRGNIEVDISVYKKTWVLGPYALDFLSVSRSFELSHHKNTVAHHDYPVFGTQHLQQAPTATAVHTDQTEPSKPKPKPTSSPLRPSARPLARPAALK
jgi:hypothetical protein